MMNCKNISKKLDAINKVTGVDKYDIEKAKHRMRFYMELMNNVLKDKDFSQFRGKKFSCFESLILELSVFFECTQEKMDCGDSFSTSLKIATENEFAYCEGFVLPMEGGMPILQGWVFDKSKKKIITGHFGLHYGISFNPSYALERFHETGVVGIFNSDKYCKKPILNFGITKEMLFD